jgi:leader peptidase (prepilin peptidase)/N-methyltransferase
MTTRATAAPAVAARASSVDRGVAFAAAVVALLCLLRVGASGDGVIAGFAGFVLVWLAAIDVRERVLPNRIVIPATVVALLLHIALAPSAAPEWILATFGAALVFFIPASLRPGALGMGDVKLAMLLGALLGRAVVGALAVGLFAAGAFALLLVLVRGRSALKTDIPLGPFLALGALVALLA